MANADNVNVNSEDPKDAAAILGTTTLPEMIDIWAPEGRQLKRRFELMALLLEDGRLIFDAAHR